MVNQPGNSGLKRFHLNVTEDPARQKAEQPEQRIGQTGGSRGKLSTMAFNRNSSLYRTAALGAHALGIRYFDLLYGEIDLLERIPDITSPLDLEIRKGRQDEIRELALIRGGDMVRRFEFALSTGSICHIAWYGGKAAGCTWYNKKTITIDMIKIGDVPPGGSFRFDSFVFPEFRGRKVFQCLLNYIFHHLREEGCRFAGSFVDRENLASIRGQSNFPVSFQPVRLLKAPGLPVVFLGRKFAPGASLAKS